MKHSFWFVATALFFTLTGCGQATNVSVPTKDDQPLDITVNVAQVNDNLETKLTIKNETDEEIKLDFMSGQKYELVLKNAAGEELYRFSKNHMFTMALTHELILPGESVEFEELIDVSDLEPGMYTLEVTLLVAAINGEAPERTDSFRNTVKVELL